MKENPEVRAWRLMAAYTSGLAAVAFGLLAVTGALSVHEQAEVEAEAIATEVTPSLLQESAESWATNFWGAQLAPQGVNPTVTVAPVICAKTTAEAIWPEEKTSSSARTTFDIIIATTPTPTIIYAAPATSEDPLCTPQTPTPAWILGLMDDMRNEKEATSE